jgi:hypothetical protein
MAAPHVSGVAALLLAAFLALRFPNSEIECCSPRRDRGPASQTATGGRVNAYARRRDSGRNSGGFGRSRSAERSALERTPFSITVSDLKAVRDATVSGRTSGEIASIVFRNDGQAPIGSPTTELTANIRIPRSGETFDLSLTVTAPSQVPFAGDLAMASCAADNDDFDMAFTVDPDGGILFGSNKAATLEAREPAHAQLPALRVGLVELTRKRTAGSYLTRREVRLTPSWPFTPMMLFPGCNGLLPRTISA